MQAIESFDFPAALLDLLTRSFSATDAAGRPVYQILQDYEDDPLVTCYSVYEINSGLVVCLRFILQPNYGNDTRQPPLLQVQRFSVTLMDGQSVHGKPIYSGPFPVVFVKEKGIQLDPRFSFVLSHITCFR